MKKLLLIGAMLAVASSLAFAQVNIDPAIFQAKTVCDFHSLNGAPPIKGSDSKYQIGWESCDAIAAEWEKSKEAATVKTARENLEREKIKALGDKLKGVK